MMCLPHPITDHPCRVQGPHEVCAATPAGASWTDLEETPMAEQTTVLVRDDLDLNAAEERATAYVAIFINAGDRWQGFVPVDGRVLDADSVRIGPVTVTREPEGVWRLETPGRPAIQLRRGAS